MSPVPRMKSGTSWDMRSTTRRCCSMPSRESPTTMNENGTSLPTGGAVANSPFHDSPPDVDVIAIPARRLEPVDARLDDRDPRGDFMHALAARSLDDQLRRAPARRSATSR